MRNCTVLLLFAATAVCVAAGSSTVQPLHNLTWCKASYTCTEPEYPIVGVYAYESVDNIGYSCWCTAVEGTCLSANGEQLCMSATLGNCLYEYIGESQAAAANGEYGLCYDCFDAYQLSDYPNPSPECWVCSGTVPNCAHCSSAGVCDTCNSQYTLSSDGKTCYACDITACNGCTADNVCGSCASGYTLSPNAATCYTCNIAGCTSCTADNVCGTCSPGHTLSLDHKSCFTCGITGCSNCSSNDVCGSCETGYTLSADGKHCYACGITGCTSCTDDNVCESCESDYTLATDHQSCFRCGIANCNGCIASGVCGSCQEGYARSPDTATCYACNITGCSSCATHNVCGACASGYKLSDSRVCKKDGIAWWVWLIVGLAAAVVIAVVIVVVWRCCLCAKAQPIPLLADGERVATDAELGAGSATNEKLADIKDDSAVPLQRVRSNRKRRVSIGGEVVLNDSNPDLPALPSSHSILCASSVHDKSAVVPQFPAKVANPFDLRGDSGPDYYE